MAHGTPIDYAPPLGLARSRYTLVGHTASMADRPTIEEANELPVDELAIRILEYFGDLPDLDNMISRRGIGNPGVWVEGGMNDDEVAAAKAASMRCLEAVDWLVHHGLVAPRQEATGFTETGYITPRGREMLASDNGLAKLRAEERLNITMHPLLERKIRAQFLLGEYELAAFAAMREVEIRVRSLGGYANSDIGYDLMRKAFNVGTGPLTDPGQVPGEKQGTSDLFAGAIAVFKNPSSHRQVDFEDPTVASEIVLLADLLLRLLDGVADRLGK